ncbi:hypothetical protein Hanom_Chr05g00450121 [Helianthus anomalus]
MVDVLFEYAPLLETSQPRHGSRSKSQFSLPSFLPISLSASTAKRCLTN